MTIRVLITGSRRWTDRSAIALAVSDYLRERGTSIGRAYPFPVVVHGGAKGADALADAVARSWGWTPEVHPADWSTCAEDCDHGLNIHGNRIYCPLAGHRRNQRMVDLGADVCLAFPTHDSRGTWDCVRRAEAAGIPVRVAPKRVRGDYDEVVQ